jgi:hypothetical protein
MFHTYTVQFSMALTKRMEAGSTRVIMTLVGFMTVTQTAAQCATPDPAAFFRVTAASPTFTCTGGTVPTGPAGGTCFITAEGCITDGPGNYGNNERCTIEVLRDVDLFLPPGDEFGIEGGFDGFDQINGPFDADRSSEIEGVTVQAGSTIVWSTDGSVERAGFTLCATVRCCTWVHASLPAKLPPATQFSVRAGHFLRNVPLAVSDFDL